MNIVVLGKKLRRYGEPHVRSGYRYAGIIGRVRVALTQNSDGRWQAWASGVKAEWGVTQDMRFWSPEEAAEKMSSALRSLGLKDARS